MKKSKVNPLDVLRSRGISFLNMSDANVLHGDNDFDAIIALIGSGERIEVPVLLTPKLAKLFFVELNRNIRRAKRSRIQAYVGDIKAGGWVPWVARLCFNKQGHMVNGQHTCAAFVETSHSSIVTLRIGFTKEDEEVCDNGAPRRADETAGVKKYISNVLNAIKSHGFYDRTVNTTTSLKSYRDRYGKYVELLHGVFGHHKSTDKEFILRPAFLAAVAKSISDGMPPKVALAFVNAVADKSLPNSSVLVDELKEGIPGCSARQSIYGLTRQALSQYPAGGPNE
jgi:hypothetical protein